MIDLHQSMDSNTWQSNSYAEKKTLRLKGQMNPKIDIFSVVALPSPNTKKKHPKWDLGKDFSSQAFIERWKIKIPAFPKTSPKRFWNGRAIDWRLRDVNVSLSGRKNVLRKLLRIPYRLRLFVSFCESSDRDWMKYTRCQRFLRVKAFFCLFFSLLLFFRHLKITLDSEQPMLE